MHFQAAHLRHANINQRDLWAMSARIGKKRLGIAKCFQRQIGRLEEARHALEHRRVIIEQADNKGAPLSHDPRLRQNMGEGYGTLV